MIQDGVGKSGIDPAASSHIHTLRSSERQARNVGKRCQEPNHCFLGRPHVRRVDSKPKRRAVRSLHETSPNGLPHCMLRHATPDTFSEWDTNLTNPIKFLEDMGVPIPPSYLPPGRSPAPRAAGRAGCSSPSSHRAAPKPSPIARRPGHASRRGPAPGCKAGAALP